MQVLLSEIASLAGLLKKLAEQIALAAQHTFLASLAASIIFAVRHRLSTLQ